MKKNLFSILGAGLIMVAVSTFVCIKYHTEGTTLFSANIEALAEQEEVVVTCSAGNSGYCFEKITAWPLCKCVWTGRPKDYCDCYNSGFIG
jgi:hypothetical protein